MKKLILLTVVICCFGFSLKADLGSCVVYQAKFYLKNGTTLNGCFEVSGYDKEAYLDEKGTNSFCNDKGVLSLFKKLQREYYRKEKVPVYKQLHYVSFTRVHQPKDQTDSWSSRYGFVLQGDVFGVDSADIIKMVFWHAEYSKRDWTTTRIIEGTQGMLDTIQQQRYWNSIPTKRMFKDDSIVRQDVVCIVGAFSNYILYNFNPKINSTELERIALLKLTDEEDKSQKEFIKKNNLKAGQWFDEQQTHRYNKLRKKKMQQTADWFWGKGIIIIGTNETC